MEDVKWSDHEQLDQARGRGTLDDFDGYLVLLTTQHSQLFRSAASPFTLSFCQFLTHSYVYVFSQRRHGWSRLCDARNGRTWRPSSSPCLTFWRRAGVFRRSSFASSARLRHVHAQGWCASPSFSFTCNFSPSLALPHPPPVSLHSSFPAPPPLDLSFSPETFLCSLQGPLSPRSQFLVSSPTALFQFAKPVILFSSNSLEVRRTHTCRRRRSSLTDALRTT